LNVIENEFKKINQKLKESEEKFMSVFMESPIAITLYNSEGKLIDANKACLDLINVSNVEDINGFDIFDDPNLPKDEKEKLRKGETVRFEIVYNFDKVKKSLKANKSGILYFSAIISPIYLKSKGSVSYYLNQVQDITNLKLSEEKLKESEVKLRKLNIELEQRIEERTKELKESGEKFRRIFEAIPDLFFLVSSDTTILNYKSYGGSSKDFYVPPEEFLGKPFKDFMPPEVTNLYVKNMKKTLETQKPSIIEYSLQMNGKDQYYESRILYFDVDQLALFIREITYKKEAELKLKEVNKLKTELMRRTSHELKTPLISIKGFSDLLLDVHYDKFDDETISIIKEIKKGSVRLEALINDILKSSKLDSDQIKLNLLKEDLAFLIRFNVNELKMLLKMRNQTISLNLSDNLIVKCEKERIYDVINNLLTNAIKYSPPNSEILVQSEIKDDFIVISVKDNGIGFTEEEKKIIFQQFGKIEHYGQGWDIETSGSGLGLYIAKKIVELHGGKIWMESEGRDKGSTFYFSLPIIEK